MPPLLAQHQIDALYRTFGAGVIPSETLHKISHTLPAIRKKVRIDFPTKPVIIPSSSRLRTPDGRAVIDEKNVIKGSS